MSSRIIEFDPAPAPLLTLYQRAMLGLLALLVMACGTLAAAAWRAVDGFVRQDALRHSELREFHGLLLSDLRSLTEKSGMLTSADLCPVRFRLRFEGAMTPPALPVQALLSRPDDPTFCRHVASNAGGVVEFGLVPPGDYCVAITTQDDYRLEHDFSVLPGVPVDRLVLCPHASAPGLDWAVRVVWPQSLRDRGLAAIVEVERDDVAVGDWLWKPRERRPVRAVAAADGQDVAEVGASLRRANSEMDLVTGVPHRYCRLVSITVNRLDESGPGSQAESLTFVYDADRPGLAGATSHVRAAVTLNMPPPRYECPLEERAPEWVVVLPREVEIALQQALADRTLGGGPALSAVSGREQLAWPRHARNGGTP